MQKDPCPEILVRIEQDSGVSKLNIENDLLTASIKPL